MNTLPEAVAKAVQERRDILFFIDSHGNVDDEPLVEELAPTSPRFEICTVVDGQVMDAAGNVLDPNDPQEIENAKRTAFAERERFYTEREATYGPDAWPKTQTA